MSRFFILLLVAVVFGPRTNAQTFNPANKYLISGLGYAFTTVADTGMSLVRIKLKTLDLFQKKLAAHKAGQPAKSFPGIDTLFRTSAFEACLQEIDGSPMVAATALNDSARRLIRKDLLHATAGIYDTAGGNLPVFLWCQGLIWTTRLNVPLEDARKAAHALDRVPLYASIANWGLIQGNIAPLGFTTSTDSLFGSENLRVPNGQSRPIAFSLHDIMPNAGLPNVSFDYRTEAARYLAGIQPKPSAGNPNSKKALFIAERMPQFKGDLMRYLSNSLEYPETARAANIEGILMLCFVVTETGAIDKIFVERGTGSLELDAEGIRMLEHMPPWQPGAQRDETGKLQPVKVYYRLPIAFTLN